MPRELEEEVCGAISPTDVDPYGERRAMTLSRYRPLNNSKPWVFEEREPTAKRAAELDLISVAEASNATLRAERERLPAGIHEPEQLVHATAGLRILDSLEDVFKALVVREHQRIGESDDRGQQDREGDDGGEGISKHERTLCTRRASSSEAPGSPPSK